MITTHDCRWEFEGVPEDAGLARRLVRAQLACWVSESYAGEVVLLVSELVTNAIRHAGTAVELHVHIDPADRTLRVEVADRTGPWSPYEPPACDELEAEHGRGLALLDGLSAKWGVDKTANGGKVVWFVRELPRTPSA